MKSFLTLALGSVLFASSPVLACECAMKACMTSAKSDAEKTSCEAKKGESCSCKHGAKKNGACGCKAEAKAS